MAPTKKTKLLSVSKQQNEVIPCNKTTQSPLDHWSFLDEIEAPMWIDLNCEATGTLHENDDGWFLMTHQFHQCSSRQLISAFSHSGEVCTNSLSGKQEPCSPKLPSSVSKSRGKHYKNREWAQSNCMLTTKKFPVKNINSELSGVTSEDVKIKPQPEIGRVKKCGLLPPGVDCENNVTETAGSSTSKSKTSFGHSNTYAGARVVREGGKNSIGTVRSESIERNEDSLEVYRQINGQPSKLLSSLRISLRKSCVARPAAKMDINRVRKSVGPKSSSSKSSVGSSSHPGQDGNNMTARRTLYNDKTPDSRNAIEISQAPKNILKGSSLSKASPVLRNMTSSSGQKIESDVQKSVNQETSKAKVQIRPLRPKALLSQRMHGQDRLIASRTKGNVQVSEHRKRFPGAGKENELETTTIKNSLARGKVSGVMAQVQKATKESIPVKKDVRKQVCVKKNISCRNDLETSASMVQKLYLR